MKCKDCEYFDQHKQTASGNYWCHYPRSMREIRRVANWKVGRLIASDIQQLVVGLDAVALDECFSERFTEVV